MFFEGCQCAGVLLSHAVAITTTICMHSCMYCIHLQALYVDSVELLYKGHIGPGPGNLSTVERLSTLQR